MRTALLLAAALAGAAHAEPAPKRQAPTVAYFISLQEVGAFTPEEMAERHTGGGLDDDAQAADTALNDWKLCATDSLAHWADLKQGLGTLIDGAYGRCADRERAYRDSLLKVQQDNGRPIIDLNLAKSMMRMLEEVWRPRLTAAALDQDLAALKGVPKGVVTVGSDTPAPPPPTKERERRR